MRRLRLEQIELYQLHRIDPKVPFEDQMGALKEFQGEGKVHYLGLSKVKVDEIERARKFVSIVSVQNRYNLTDRVREPVLQYCQQHNIAFIPRFPVAAGKLAQRGGPLDEIAKRHGASVAQLSIAWLLHHSPVMLPIPGTSNVRHLEENVASANLRLSAGEWGEVERSAGV